MRPASFVILVIDDDRDDLLLVQRAFRHNGLTGPIHCLKSGEEALAYLDGRAPYSDRAKFPYPSFILTDLHMPCGDGLTVLQFLRDRPHWRVVPTVILTASADQSDITTSYHMGASAYLVKPSQYEVLRDLVRTCYQFWMACEVPDVDATGHWVQTEHRGKLGERFAKK